MPCGHSERIIQRKKADAIAHGRDHEEENRLGERIQESGTVIVALPG